MGIFKGIAGLATSGPGGRAILGAIGGAATGALQGYEGPNMRGESIAKGAFLGALGGGLISKAPKLAYSGINTVARGSMLSATPLGRMGGFAKKGLAMAARHPIGTAATAAGLYGATQYNYGSSGTSPTMSGAKVSTAYNQQAIAMDQMTMGGAAGLGMVGTAPQMMNRYHRTLQQSTQGLTQGLHRSRHG